MFRFNRLTFFCYFVAVRELSEVHGAAKPMSRPPKTDRRQQRHGLYAVRDAVRALEADARERIGSTCSATPGGHSGNGGTPSSPTPAGRSP